MFFSIDPILVYVIKGYSNKSLKLFTSEYEYRRFHYCVLPVLKHVKFPMSHDSFVYFILTMPCGNVFKLRNSVTTSVLYYGFQFQFSFFVDVKRTCHKVVSTVSILYCIKGQYRIQFKTIIPLIAKLSVIIRT